MESKRTGSPDKADLSGVVLASLFAALLMTGLNALKPIHIDDVIWWQFAEQIAQHPLDPFGFTISWAGVCQPAMGVMSPPVLPYYWGAAIALFGDNPTAWKLAFLPINWIFSYAVFDLARRFAPKIGVALGLALVISPSVLPSINLMQDIPAAGFLLASLAVLLRAAESRSTRLALLSGLLLGLALLTKWSTLSGVGTLGLAVIMFAPTRRWLLWVPTVSIALFVLWEVFLIATIGQSHFLHHLPKNSGTGVDDIMSLVKALILQPGVLAPFVILAGVAALFRSRIITTITAFLVGAAFVALGVVPIELQTLNPLTDRPLRLDTPIYLILGGLFWIGATVAGLFLIWRAIGNRSQNPTSARLALFLILWVAVEIVGYFILSPFPGSRRLIVPLIAISLLVAHAFEHRLSLKNVWIAGALQVALALLFSVVDIFDAMRVKQVAGLATRTIETVPARENPFFTGQFGYEFYAAQLGSTQYCNTSQLEVGDTYSQFEFGRNPAKFLALEPWVSDGSLLPITEISIAPALPWTLVGAGFYIGPRPFEKAGDIFGQLRIFSVAKPISAGDLNTR